MRHEIHQYQTNCSVLARPTQADPIRGGLAIQPKANPREDDQQGAGQVDLDQKVASVSLKFDDHLQNRKGVTYVYMYVDLNSWGQFNQPTLTICTSGVVQAAKRGLFDVELRELQLAFVGNGLIWVAPNVSDLVGRVGNWHGMKWNLVSILAGKTSAPR